jgi:hypothetical protein
MDMLKSMFARGDISAEDFGKALAAFQVGVGTKRRKPAGAPANVRTAKKRQSTANPASAPANVRPTNKKQKTAKGKPNPAVDKQQQNVASPGKAVTLVDAPILRTVHMHRLVLFAPHITFFWFQEEHYRELAGRFCSQSLRGQFLSAFKHTSKTFTRDICALVFPKNAPIVT